MWKKPYYNKNGNTTHKQAEELLYHQIIQSTKNANKIINPDVERILKEAI